MAESTSTIKVPLKTLLAAGTALLQPPAPLPSSPPLLVARLHGGTSTPGLPEPWTSTHGWTDVDAHLDLLGRQDGSPFSSPSDVIETETAAQERHDKERKEAREVRDKLVIEVGKRCLDILAAMQNYLEKEFWPSGPNGDPRDPKDFLLGTADLRVMRLMLSHAVASYLLPLAISYHLSLLKPPSIPSPVSTATSFSLSSSSSSSSSSSPSTALSSALSRLLDLAQTSPPPSTPSAGPSSTPFTPPTLLTQTLISSHLPPLLLSSFILGWTPTAPPPVHAALRSAAVRVAASVSPTQAIAALGAVLRLVQRRTEKIGPGSASAGGKSAVKRGKGWARQWPGYVEAVVTGQISAQVRRPGGVRGVMENVFGEAANIGSNEAVDGDKLEHVASVLSKLPKTVPAEVYVPQLLSALFELISPIAVVPALYTHAACYTVQHLWTGPHRALVESYLGTKLHRPLLDDSSASQIIPPGDTSESETAVRLASFLVLHAPPSPAFTHFIVSPIVTPLFALHATARASRVSPLVEVASRAGKEKDKGKGKEEGTGDLAEAAREMLVGWAKLVDKDEGVKAIWSVIDDSKKWSVNEEGCCLSWMKGSGSWTMVYGPIKISENNEEGDELDTSLLNDIHLFPDPEVFASWLKHVDRAEVSSEVFLRVIEGWRVRAALGEDDDPLRTMLFLRLTMAMMEKMGERLVQRPEQVLEFVEGVLSDEASIIKQSSKGVESVKVGHEKRRPLIQVVGEDEEDTDEGKGTVLPESVEGVEKLGLVETAVSLLLASLEANEGTNHSTTSILFPITDHLEVLSDRSTSSDVRHLAREALLVLLVRRSTSLSSTPNTTSTAPSRAISTYRRALTLVADPILPVRAHGLAVLRDLVHEPEYDPALTPAIMDVFVQSVLDKDSFVYLHAAQGLAAMVDVLGREVCAALMGRYKECLGGGMGVGGGSAGEERMDKALRIGEALGMVIRRAGSALSVYADLIVPVLGSTLLTTSLPVIVRASALSLLSACAEADHLALAPWSADLSRAALDLVQLESVRSDPFRRAQDTTSSDIAEDAARAGTSGPAGFNRRKIVLVDDEEEETPEPEPAVQKSEPRVVDADPTTGDAKHPALRRAAIVFLGMLFASLIEAAMDGEGKSGEEEFVLRLPGQMAVASGSKGLRGDRSGGGDGMDEGLVMRARTVMAYVAQTDDDEVARGQAGEVVALAVRLGQVQHLKQLQR